MKPRLGLVLLASLLGAIDGAASQSRVVLDAELHPPGTEQRGALSAIVALESVSARNLPVVNLPLTVPGSSEATLAPGVWRAELRGDGLFHEPQILVIPQSAPVHATLHAWRTGIVKGRIEVADGTNLPHELEVRWNAASERAEAPPPRGARRCPVDDGGGFACEVPIARLDLRVRAETYVSKYLWGIRVSDEAHDAGVLALQHGASIVGWIQPERGATVDLTKVAVNAKSAAAQKVVSPDARGFFHIERIPPGDYVLDARLGDMAADSRTVHVAEGSESELIREVILTRARQLAVEVQPRRTFDERSWQMRLERVHDEQKSEVVAHGETDATGRIVWKGIRPGTYTVFVAEDAHAVVAARELEVSSDETLVQVNVPRTRVTGRVSFRDRGVAVRLWLGGRNRIPSVEVHTDDDGRFSATVPFDPAEEWLVTLESRAPRITRTLRVKPSVNEGTQEATLDIALPGNVITGRVVDERGDSVDRAIVNLLHKGAGAGTLLQATVEGDGEFEFDGIEKGQYEVQANDFRQQQSDVVPIVVDDAQPHREVELTVRKKLRLVGRVIVASGRPVANAEVTAMPADRPFLHGAAAMTDADGVFSLSLPPDTRGTDFMIAAEGLALKTFHVPAPENGLTFVLEPTGGQLVFDVPQFVDDPGALHPYFGHKGAWIAVRALLHRPGSSLQRSKRGNAYVTLSHPLVDDGDYSLCLLHLQELPAVRSGALPGGRCASGSLSSWGTLTLDSPPVR